MDAIAHQIGLLPAIEKTLSNQKNEIQELLDVKIREFIDQLALKKEAEMIPVNLDINSVLNSEKLPQKELTVENLASAELNYEDDKFEEHAPTEEEIKEESWLLERSS